MLALLANIWSNLLPQSMVMRTYVEAAHRARSEDCGHARGPAVVGMYSLKDLGWTTSAERPATWFSMDGSPMRIFVTAPKDIIRRFKDDLLIGLWSSMSEADTVFKRLEARPWLAPDSSVIQAEEHGVFLSK